jgi:hypothetical protein
VKCLYRKGSSVNGLSYSSDNLDSISEPYAIDAFRQWAGPSRRRRRPHSDCTKKSVDLRRSKKGPLSWAV